MKYYVDTTWKRSTSSNIDVVVFIRLIVKFNGNLNNWKVLFGGAMTNVAMQMVYEPPSIYNINDAQ